MSITNFFLTKCFLPFVLGCALPAVAMAAKTDSDEFENAIGWEWIMPPEPPSLIATNGRIMLSEEGAEGAFIVTVIRSRTEDPFLRERPIVVDTDGNRYEPSRVMGAGAGGLSLQRWRIHPAILKADKVAHVGLEGMTAEGIRALADHSRSLAEKKGLRVLVMPQVGQELTFEFTDLDGGTISSAEFRGKVLVVDCWATWCGPCMAKMPELRELHEKWRPNGLEIVGLNFDEDVASAKQAIDKFGMSWRHIRVPADESDRKLWMDASGIHSIPRIFVIDREGILQFDSTPPELETHLASLLSSVESDEVSQR